MLKDLLHHRKAIPDGAIWAALGVIAIMVAGGNTPWLVMMIGLLFYAVYSEISGLFSERWPRYTGTTYALFAVMGVLWGLLASYSATDALGHLPKYIKFLVLIVLFKLVLTGLALLYRTVLSLIKEID